MPVPSSLCRTWLPINAGRQFSNWQLGVGYVAVQYKDKKVQNTTLEGDLPTFATVNDVQLQEGRPFTEDEEFRARQRRHPGPRHC